MAKVLLKGGVAQALYEANYGSWFRGMAVAFNRAGASAFRATFVAMLALPQYVNLEHPGVVIKVAAIAWLVKGLQGWSEYIEAHPWADEGPAGPSKEEP